MKDRDIVQELEGFDVGKQLAVFKKIGGRNRVEALLRDELVVIEKEKIINVVFTNTSANLLNGGVSFATPVPPVLDTKIFLDEMAAFYGKVYDIKLPKVTLPLVKEGFCWGLVMPLGITIEQDLAGCKKDYDGVWRWTDKNLDKIVKSVRSADEKPFH